MNLDDWNHAVENCSFCFAQVLAQNYSAHVEWHNAQHQILSDIVDTFKALTK